MTNEEIAKALAEIDSRCKSNIHRLEKLMKAHSKESGPETATGVGAQ